MALQCCEASQLLLLRFCPGGILPSYSAAHSSVWSPLFEVWGPLQLAERAESFSVPGHGVFRLAFPCSSFLGHATRATPQGIQSSWGLPVVSELGPTCSYQDVHGLSCGVAVWPSHPGCKPKVTNAAQQGYYTPFVAVLARRRCFPLQWGFTLFCRCPPTPFSTSLEVSEKARPARAHVHHLRGWNILSTAGAYPPFWPSLGLR